ncbi:catalase [Nocardia sp. 2]|uniref:Catalase n=1 Tax=Nocardia acididurans TaxID=2802282 RepID=A0ABS1MH00_9NOCA|nr:catalase [Nocardia acididurans]MBL1079947.1 catalase [Nocardia acididurans]
MDANDYQRLVERMTEATGSAPGQRLLHTRGTWVAGFFEPVPLASDLCAAGVFGPDPTPVTGRFSSTLGGARGHDGDAGDHGFAVRMGELDLVMFTLPVFFVRTAADMVEFLEASGSGDGERMAAFLHHHPEAATAMHLAETACPITSFTGVSYHGVHAFGLVDQSGAERFARLRWRPLRALPALDPAAACARPPDYLATELASRLPARFALTAQVPGTGHDIHDPTRLWPETEEIPLGILTLNRVESPTREPDFDPLRLPPGMLAPLDQLARDRHRLYRSARLARFAADIR